MFSRVSSLARAADSVTHPCGGCGGSGGAPGAAAYAGRMVRPVRPLAATVAVLLGGALLGGGALAFGASPAAAHNYLVSSTPEEGAALTTLPERFEVVTNDALLSAGEGTGGFAMQVTGPDGRFYGDGCVEVDGSSMSAAATLGPAGAYTLDWQLVSADGHSVSGEIPFDWAPSAATQAEEGSTTPPVCGASAPGVTPPSVAPTAGPEEEAQNGTGTGAGAGDDASSDDGTSAEGEDEAGGAAVDDSSDVLWIGGAVLVVAVVAVTAYLLVARGRDRRARSDRT